MHIENEIILVLAFVGWYFIGRIDGYASAMRKIKNDSVKCPHGQEWDDCPDCHH